MDDNAKYIALEDINYLLAHPLSKLFTEGLLKIREKVLNNHYTSLESFKRSVTELLRTEYAVDVVNSAGKELHKKHTKKLARISSMNAKSLGFNLYIEHLKSVYEKLLAAGHANPGDYEVPDVDDWRATLAGHHIIPAEVVRDLILKNNKPSEFEKFGALFNDSWNGIMLRHTGRTKKAVLEDHEEYYFFTPEHTRKGKPQHREYSEKITRYIQDHYLYKAIAEIPFELEHLKFYMKICEELKQHIVLDLSPLDDHEF